MHRYYNCVHLCKTLNNVKPKLNCSHIDSDTWYQIKSSHSTKQIKLAHFSAGTQCAVVCMYVGTYNWKNKRVSKFVSNTCWSHNYQLRLYEIPLDGNIQLAYIRQLCGIIVSSFVIKLFFIYCLQINNVLVWSMVDSK